MLRHATTTPEGEEVSSILLSRGPDGLQVEILTYGATIHKLLVPGGTTTGYRDVVLGFDKPEEYFGDHPFFGCVVGRFANRIRNAQFDLDGRTVKVSENRPPHSLHGGFQGQDPPLLTYLFNAED